MQNINNSLVRQNESMCLEKVITFLVYAIGWIFDIQMVIAR